MKLSLNEMYVIEFFISLIIKKSRISILQIHIPINFDNIFVH